MKLEELRFRRPRCSTFQAYDRREDEKTRRRAEVIGGQRARHKKWNVESVEGVRNGNFAAQCVLHSFTS